MTNSNDSTDPSPDFGSDISPELVGEIKSLAPWHHDIQLTETFSTGIVFSDDRVLLPKENQGVSLISPDKRFFQRANSLYPDGMSGVRFLDCACNGGIYCFLARQLDAELAVGFDVRDHWINQAKFVQKHRQIHPTDRIEFHVSDLYDLPSKKLDTFHLTYFSGLFYHLPDPITGLKIAADLTEDILVLNTSCLPKNDHPYGLTMSMESREVVMSGVHALAWLPNSPELLCNVLAWLGFKQIKLTIDNVNPTSKRRRVELIASRNKGRLDNLAGTEMEVPGQA
ncbi:MAG: class I SAM-dependent methyltransferase [Mariniblastus sp.]